VRGVIVCVCVCVCVLVCVLVCCVCVCVCVCVGVYLAALLAFFLDHLTLALARTGVLFNIRECVPDDAIPAAIQVTLLPSPAVHGASAVRSLRTHARAHARTRTRSPILIVAGAWSGACS
jgi:hypothetical protein